MSKLLTVIKKNYKFLLHHKFSTAAIVLGPILLIILAGIAFNTTQLTGIKVGIYSDAEDVKFIDEFAKMLNGNDFKTIKYLENSTCEKDLEKGKVHVCTIYSSKNKNINFIVDSSKINLAYAILSVMSDQLDSATDEMGFALTTSLLKQVNGLKSFLDESMIKSEDIVDKNRELSKGLKDISSELYSLELDLNPDFDFDEIKQRTASTNNNIEDFRDIVNTKIGSSLKSLNEFDKSAEELQDDIDDKAEERDEVYDYLDETYTLNSCTSTTNLASNLEGDLFAIYKSEEEPECTAIYTMRESLDVCTGDLKEARTQINSLRGTIDSSKKDLREVQTQSDTMFSGAKNDLGSTVKDISNAEKEVKELEKTSKEIEKSKNILANQLGIMGASVDEGIEYFENYSDGLKNYKSTFDEYSDLSARDIVSPVVTTVEGFDSNKGMIDYFLPTLIVFIMMFVGILLGNILISKEGKSSGFFRNLISPTNDYIFLFGTIITTASIVIIQMFVVMLLGVVLLKLNIMASLLPLVILMFLGVLMFSLIGVIIGCIIHSEETAMIISIILSLILLIFSGTLIPIESTPVYLHRIIKLNPFLVLSEMFGSVLIYGLDILDFKNNFYLLLGYVVFLFGSALAAFNMMKRKYMN